VPPAGFAIPDAAGAAPGSPPLRRRLSQLSIAPPTSNGGASPDNAPAAPPATPAPPPPPLPARAAAAAALHAAALCAGLAPSLPLEVLLLCRLLALAPHATSSTAPDTAPPLLSFPDGDAAAAYASAVLAAAPALPAALGARLAAALAESPALCRHAPQAAAAAAEAAAAAKAAQQRAERYDATAAAADGAAAPAGGAPRLGLALEAACDARREAAAGEPLFLAFQALHLLTHSTNCVAPYHSE
jgi:hypothetical protein